MWLEGLCQPSPVRFLGHSVLQKVYLVDGFSCRVKDSSLLRGLRDTHVVVVD